MKTYLNTTTGYNPFFASNSEFLNVNRLGGFVFFDSSKREKICTVKNGWLSDGNNEYKNIVFDFETKTKRKEDLSINKYAYLLKYKDEYTNEIKYYLYIPISLLKEFVCNGTKQYIKTSLYTGYCEEFSFIATANKKIWAKDGRKTEGFKEQKITFRCNYRQEDTDTAKYCKQIAEVAKSVHVNLNYYDIEKLLDILNITIK